MLVNCPKCRLCYDYKIGKHYTCSCGTEFIIDESGKVLVIDAAPTTSQAPRTATPPPPEVRSIFSGSKVKSAAPETGFDINGIRRTRTKCIIACIILPAIAALCFCFMIIFMQAILNDDTDMEYKFAKYMGLSILALPIASIWAAVMWSRLMIKLKKRFADCWLPGIFVLFCPAAIILRLGFQFKLGMILIPAAWIIMLDGIIQATNVLRDLKSALGRDSDDAVSMDSAGRKGRISKRWLIYGFVLVLMAVVWWRLESLGMIGILARFGNAKAQYTLGVFHDRGTGVPKDPKLAAKWFRKAAEKGYAKAQFHLGACHEYGRGVAKDYTEAVKWYRKAAEQGYARAQNNLGVCYEYGRGVAKDYTEAVKWYRNAAEQGNAMAQLNLGTCYYNGRGVAKDPKQAVHWYRKAAEQGYALAQFNLGLCCANGEGVPKDLKQAAYWYRKAAEQGDSTAQYNLGVCYANGFGVPKDYPEAVKWFRKAAERGLKEAQYNLGYCYYNGFGVPKDLEQAAEWYRKAAEQGHEPAKAELKRLGR